MRQNNARDGTETSTAPLALDPRSCRRAMSADRNLRIGHNASVSQSPREAEVERAQRELHRGIADPDAFFADRGIVLTCWYDGEEWWAATSDALVNTGAERQTRTRRSRRRRMTEQEHPDLQRRPGQSLP
jgi:hypothetical protein